MARTIDAIVKDHLGMQQLMICQLQAQIEELREENDKLKAETTHKTETQGQSDGRDPREP